MAVNSTLWHQLSSLQQEVANSRDSNPHSSIDRYTANKKFNQEVDTNVFSINMSTLKQGGEGYEIASGDPIFCKQCNAAFNMHSKVEEVKRDEGEPSQVWQCEFCLVKNDVFIEPEEMPKGNQVNYIVEATAQVLDKK